MNINKNISTTERLVFYFLFARMCSVFCLYHKRCTLNHQHSIRVHSTFRLPNKCLFLFSVSDTSFSRYTQFAWCEKCRCMNWVILWNIASSINSSRVMRGAKHIDSKNVRKMMTNNRMGHHVLFVQQIIIPKASWQLLKPPPILSYLRKYVFLSTQYGPVLRMNGKTNASLLMKRVHTFVRTTLFVSLCECGVSLCVPN